MTRIEFTKNLTALLSEMIIANENVILDYVKRSEDEQKRLFDAGLSKCDGKEKPSTHQFGKAADLYFIINGKIYNEKDKYLYWHKIWTEKYGGKPMIEW